MNIQAHGAMVAAENLRANECLVDVAAQPVGHQKIVNSPADALFSCIHAVAPPAISSLRIRIEITERISKAGVQKLCKLCAFLIGKAGVSLLVFGFLRSIS